MIRWLTDAPHDPAGYFTKLAEHCAKHGYGPVTDKVVDK